MTTRLVQHIVCVPAYVPAFDCTLCIYAQKDGCLDELVQATVEKNGPIMLVSKTVSQYHETKQLHKKKTVPTDKLESSQSPQTSAKAMLLARWQHHIRLGSGFHYTPLRAMLTKISK